MYPKEFELVPQQTTWNKLTGGQMFVGFAERQKLGLETSKAVREWLYEFGIQPDSYMFKKFGSKSIEIRFLYETDYALVKIAQQS